MTLTAPGFVSEYELGSSRACAFGTSPSKDGKFASSPVPLKRKNEATN